MAEQTSLKVQGQIYLAGKLGGRSAKDWETGQTYNIISNNVTFNGNTVQDAGPGQYVVRYVPDRK